jgi:replication-associated recombination protein RarA
MSVAPYFGHQKILQAIPQDLPGVLLFLGPKSVGKWELAEYIRADRGFLSADVLRVRRLTQENARFVAKFSSERPQGDAKLVIVRLDRKATKVAQNTLLKTLEDHKSTHFILISEDEPLPTITSRATVYRFGLLTDSEVAEILINRRNFSRDRAELLASHSRGQVSRALSLMQDQDGKLIVLQALDAIYRKDLKTLESLSAKWQTEHTDLTVKWCYEVLTQRWNLFNPEESRIIGTKVPMRILIALRADLRPRLAVRAGLASVLQEMR